MFAQNRLGAVYSFESESNVGFDGLMHEAVLKAQRASSVQQAADIVLTLVGRVARDDAIKMLTAVDRELLENNGSKAIFPHIAGFGALESLSTYMGVTPYGRMRLFQGKACPKHTIAFAKTQIEPSQYQAYEEKRHQYLAGQDRLARDFFAQAFAQDMRAVIDRVEFAVDHIDPVVIYVNEETFTNFDQYNNLLGRNAVKIPGYLITDLRGKSVDEWSLDERVLISSIHMLATAGVRIEEFNGQQMNLGIVEGVLRTRYADLCALAAEPEQATCLFELPEKIVALRLKVRPDHFAYRLVNGLTFNKHEHYMRRSEVDISVGSMPLRISEQIKSKYDLAPKDFARVDDYFKAVIACLPKNENVCSENLTKYEDLLRLIVCSAMEETASDIGMTRGLRDFTQWSEFFLTHRYAELCSMPPTEYYCAVFATAETENLLRGHGSYNKILTAIAGRMTFNSWHYTPGHCPPDQVPADRHFYIPPKMSDLAVWSDKHHQGHVLAQVRYSVRSPGGLQVNGVRQYGTFDLRLMRREGQPYELRELKIARVHTAYLRAVVQAALDASANGGHRHVVQAFTKDWYRSL